MKKQQIATFLQTVPLFHDLPPEQLDRLAQAAHEERFLADQTISEPANGDADLCVLVEGEGVEYVEQAELEMEGQLRRLYPGDSFGIESIVVPAPSRCRVVAVEQGRVIKIKGEEVDQLFVESADFARTVCRFLATRVHRAYEIVSGVRFVRLKNYPNITSVMSLLPRRISSVSRSLVVEHEGDRVTLAMANPSDVRARSFIEYILRDYHVQVVAISDEDFEQWGRKMLGERIEAGPSDAPFEQMLYQDARGVLRPMEGSLEDDLLARLLTVALRQGASDVHFEPYQGRGRVRLRIDGSMVVLDEDISAETYRKIIGRMKVLGELETTRTRRPQDGRFLIQADDQPIEFRVSTSPCHGGEKVVLRIIAPNKQHGDLSRLILQTSFERSAQELLSSPSGLVLVTGPSGAGKTTTLYAALRSVVDSNSLRNVVTIEDPVEYDLPFATQIQVNQESGMDFASILKSVLRQDPDVILFGEIRNAESAAIVAEAAATGHLVLSSLHTYSALDAIVRLRNLKIPPYVLAAGLRGVITQQLVPRLEPGYTEDVAQDDPVVQRLVELGVLDDQWEHPLVRGRESVDGPPGGESGRVAIYDILTVTPTLSSAIERSGTRAELSECLDATSSNTFRDYARFLLKEGIVAPERIVEVMPRAATQLRYDEAHWPGPAGREPRVVPQDGVTTIGD